MLGNGYWKEQGVPVLAHVDAVYEIEDSGSASLARLKRVIKEKAENSRVVLPTETFSDKRIIEFGDTRDYLLFLRGEVQARLDAGDDLQAAYLIDQSQYAHLNTFDELASRNAGRLFEQMEFE